MLDGKKAVHLASAGAELSQPASMQAANKQINTAPVRRR
jgi:hypothetical protein